MEARSCLMVSFKYYFSACVHAFALGVGMEGMAFQDGCYAL